MTDVKEVVEFLRLDRSVIGILIDNGVQYLDDILHRKDVWGTRSFGNGISERAQKNLYIFCLWYEMEMPYHADFVYHWSLVCSEERLSYAEFRMDWVDECVMYEQEY